MKYVMINLLDPNDSFEIEAETDTDAAFKALEELGWGITSHEDDGDDVARAKFLEACGNAPLRFAAETVK